MPNRDHELARAEELFAALQQRFVRVAYALHFAAANMANMTRARGQAGRGLNDAESMGWQAASEHALSAVRAWESAAPPGRPPLRVVDTDGAPRDPVAADAIRDLLLVREHLLAIERPMPDGRVRVDEAVDLVDAVLDRLRE